MGLGILKQASPQAICVGDVHWANVAAANTHSQAFTQSTKSEIQPPVIFKNPQSYIGVLSNQTLAAPIKIAIAIPASAVRKALKIFLAAAKSAKSGKAAKIAVAIKSYLPKETAVQT